MKTMICITCPNGCRLTAEEKDGEIVVTGNTCKRGVDFAVAELTHPMRTISSTVRTTFPDVPVLPVRVSCEIPKERIFDVMKEINKIVVTRPIGAGDVVIPRVLGLDADVIATSNTLLQEERRREDEYETVSGI